MQILSQRDPRWAAVTIGTTPFTVGRWGCTITSLSMLLDWFRKWKSPAELAKLLAYTSEGLLIWSSLSKVGFQLERRIYGEDRKAMDDALKNTQKGALIQVENYHWVLAVGKTWLGDYKIADPWTGTVIALKSRYKWISGAAIIKNL